MHMKARWWTLLTVLLCCSACGAPSLRHKKDVNRLLAAGDFAAAAQKVEAQRGKEYKKRDALLYYLDLGTVLHDGQESARSDGFFAQAQDRTEELFTQSLSAHAGRYLINDLTVPYYPAPYEQSLTYYYRAMNFLSQGDVGGALVEANKAVFYLDQIRGRYKAWKDDPFVQYFASLVFESAGKIDDARIARKRALNAYAALNGRNGLPVRPLFEKPVKGWGEIVVVHANGVTPLKIGQTFQVAWDQIFIWANSSREGEGVDPSVRNAVAAGLLGNTVTVAYPELEKQPFQIASSEVLTKDGRVHATLLMGDVAGAAEADLQENKAGMLLRMALRAAAKRVAAVQAKHAAAEASGDGGWGSVAEAFVSVFGALTEKADTRQWFTLPAQLRMARVYVAPGRQDVTLRFKDGYGNIIGEHTFENVPVKPGGRVYLHYRTAK